MGHESDKFVEKGIRNSTDEKSLWKESVEVKKQVMKG